MPQADLLRMDETSTSPRSPTAMWLQPAHLTGLDDQIAQSA
jgi:hypothetical protein